MGYPGHGLLPVSTPLGNYFVRGTASSKVLFMGDSHVQQYYPRIDRLLTDHPNETKTIVFVSRLGCPPVSYFEGLINPKCAGIKENAIAVAENLNVDTVVLTAGWYHYSAFDVNGPDLAYQDLAATITRFRSKGRRVYLILPIPRGDVFAPSHLVKRSFSRTGFAIVRQIARREVDREVKPLATGCGVSQMPLAQSRLIPSTTSVLGAIALHSPKMDYPYIAMRATFVRIMFVSTSHTWTTWFCRTRHLW